jgi:hypothetical protein
MPFANPPLLSRLLSDVAVFKVVGEPPVFNLTAVYSTELENPKWKPRIMR